MTPVPGWDRGSVSAAQIISKSESEEHTHSYFTYCWNKCNFSGGIWNAVTSRVFCIAELSMMTSQWRRYCSFSKFEIMRNLLQLFTQARLKALSELVPGYFDEKWAKISFNDFYDLPQISFNKKMETSCNISEFNVFLKHRCQLFCFCKETNNIIK